MPLILFAGLAACADTSTEVPLCSFDENGKVILQSGEAKAACVESAPIPTGATQETTGRITILEAPLPKPFSTLAGDSSNSVTVEQSGPVAEAMPAELSYYIRAFPRAKEPAGDVLSLGSEHTVILRDGCFFLDREGSDDPLVQFPFGTRISVDPEGYLAFNTGTTVSVRVGLPAQTGWFTEPYDAPEDVAAICRANKMVGVTTVSNPFAYPERFNPALRRYGERSGATPPQILARANQCAIRHAQREADRRLGRTTDDPIDCSRFWNF
ncbi:MAG: hypothetical protein V7676_17160 [Parasphingorhabdus sp.]|uniref:hypothetical protein n=1 Tax=Parasphingorhabdus sp. TaxID=2709688 RepID=UPI0030016CA0